MMKRALALAVAMVLLLGLSACADEMDPYLGTWEGENVVVEEFQKGFKLNDKVIRFAMVKVAN